MSRSHTHGNTDSDAYYAGIIGANLTSHHLSHHQFSHHSSHHQSSHHSSHHQSSHHLSHHQSSHHLSQLSVQTDESTRKKLNNEHKLYRYTYICFYACIDHRLYTPYAYETYKRHQSYPGFVPLIYNCPLSIAKTIP